MSADKKLEGIPGAAPAPDQIAKTETDEQILAQLQQESQQAQRRRKLEDWRRRSGLTLADEKDGPFLTETALNRLDDDRTDKLYSNSGLAEDITRQPPHWHQQPARPQVLDRFLQGTD